MILTSSLVRAFWRIRYRAQWSKLEFAEVMRQFGSPKRINQYMQVCFEYESDEKIHGRAEVWQTPIMTHELRRGDCEDFALFAWYALRAHGWEAFLVSAFTSNRGHAVCAYRDARGYHTICNEGLKPLSIRGRPREDELLPHPDVARRIADDIFPSEWECCAFVDGYRLRTLSPTEREFEPGYEWIYPVGEDRAG